MTWSTISQVGTAVGVLIAAVALIGILRTYQVSNRNAYISGLRKVMSDSRANAATINMMVNYDLIHEMASSVVNAPDIAYPIEEMYRVFFTDRSTITDNSNESDSSEGQVPHTEKDLAAFVSDVFRPITVPVKSHIATNCMDVLSGWETEIAPYQTDFPCLYRVLLSAQMFSSIIVRNNVRLVQNDDLWQRLIVEYVYPEKDKIGSVQALKYRLVSVFVQVGLIQMSDRSQATVDDYKAILDVVLGVYQAKSPKELLSASRIEKAQTLIPVSETKTLTQDLREAQKGLHKTLDVEAVAAYRDIVARLEERAKEITRPNHKEGSS